MYNINILTDPLPDAITVFGVRYPVHTSFRNWVKIACLLDAPKEKQIASVGEMLALCYKDTLPPCLESAVLGMLAYLRRTTDIPERDAGGKTSVFSFLEDSERIYAAFYKAYGVDLAKEDMHWYTFCALFSTLSEENPFATVLNIRTMEEESVDNPKAKSRIRRLKRIFALRENKKEIDAAEALEGLF